LDELLAAEEGNPHSRRMRGGLGLRVQRENEDGGGSADDEESTHDVTAVTWRYTGPCFEHALSGIGTTLDEVAPGR
jgi:hypothetical protein